MGWVIPQDKANSSGSILHSKSDQQGGGGCFITLIQLVPREGVCVWNHPPCKPPLSNHAPVVPWLAVGANLQLLHGHGGGWGLPSPLEPPTWCKP